MSYFCEKCNDFHSLLGDPHSGSNEPMCPVPKTPNNLWMDDIGSIANEATDLIIERLKKYDIKLKDKEEDDFYVPIFNALEKYSNGNYRHDD
jgi:hypothetical protein